MKPRKLVTVVGATATGKTALVVELAGGFEGAFEVISLDSRQVYRHLDVGTGKPTPDEQAAVRHHLVDFLDVEATFDAGRYRRAVEELLPRLWERGVTPVLVGGAGFYLRALTEGFHDLPDDPDRLREVRGAHAQLTLEELRARLEEVDPESSRRLHENDRYRIERALELQALTGRTASALAAAFRPRPVLDVVFESIHLTWPREELHARIARRTDDWLGGGWIDEVRELLARGVDPACAGLGILGYRDVVAHVRGERSRDELREDVIVATRRYARQQETWFRKLDPWWRGRPDDPSALESLRRCVQEASQGAAP